MDLSAIACPADVTLGMPAELEAAVRGITGESPACLRLRPGAAPFGVVAVTGAEAQSAWERLRQPAAAVGWWPVIVDPYGHRSLIDAVEKGGLDPRQALADADGIDVVAWLEARSTELELPDADDGTRPDPEPVRTIDLAIAHDLMTRAYLPELSIALVPAERSADVAGHLLYGCWNDNPCPAEHVAVLRRWEDKYGARVASMGSIVELVVDRPPETWDAAIELARELYVYDYDIVLQGTESINVLASFLVGAPQWYFWWD